MAYILYMYYDGALSVSGMGPLSLFIFQDSKISASLSRYLYHLVLPLQGATLTELLFPRVGLQGGAHFALSVLLEMVLHIVPFPCKKVIWCVFKSCEAILFHSTRSTYFIFCEVEQCSLCPQVGPHLSCSTR